jgi:hypothetical protein
LYLIRCLLANLFQNFFLYARIKRVHSASSAPLANAYSFAKYSKKGICPHKRAKLAHPLRISTTPKLILFISTSENWYSPSKVIAEGNTRENIKVWDQKIYDKIIKTKTDILNIIQKLQEKEHFEIAERILNVLERIYKYLVTYGFVEHNIIADIDKRTVFAKKIVTHRATLTKENPILE